MLVCDGAITCVFSCDACNTVFQHKLISFTANFALLGLVECSSRPEVLTRYYQP
jgi:hypothetical protein